MFEKVVNRQLPEDILSVIFALWKERIIAEWRCVAKLVSDARDLQITRSWNGVVSVLTKSSEHLLYKKHTGRICCMQVTKDRYKSVSMIKAFPDMSVLSHVFTLLSSR